VVKESCSKPEQLSFLHQLKATICLVRGCSEPNMTQDEPNLVVNLPEASDSFI